MIPPMRTCVSKYHVGDRHLPTSDFYVKPDGHTTNRCRSCAHATTNRYQRTDKGRQTKSEHYATNANAYRETSFRTKMKKIAQDKGAGYLYTSAKRRAVRYGVSFTISLTDVRVPDVCPVLNIPLVFSETKTHNTPSLDRIDNSKGYEPGNICVISWRANFMKRDLSLDDVHKLYTYMKENLNGK